MQTKNKLNKLRYERHLSSKNDRLNELQQEFEKKFEKKGKLETSEEYMKFLNHFFGKKKRESRDRVNRIRFKWERKTNIFWQVLKNEEVKSNNLLALISSFYFLK